MRRCPSPYLASRHVAFSSSSSSSSCCPVAAAGAPVLPLGIRGGRLLLPCPLLPDGGKTGASTRRTTASAAAAASPSTEGGGKPEAAGIPRTLLLGAMILVWYLLNIYFNIYNKLVRSQSPFPLSSLGLQIVSCLVLIQIFVCMSLMMVLHRFLKQCPSLTP